MGALAQAAQEANQKPLQSRRIGMRQRICLARYVEAALQEAGHLVRSLLAHVNALEEEVDPVVGQHAVVENVHGRLHCLPAAQLGKQ